MSLTLEDYRKDFERATNRSISMPLAGAIVWLVVAIISTQVNERLGLVILLFASGAIFPIALLIARLRSESVLSRENPLARLMGMSVLMVNLLWAVHIPLFIYVPAFLPLSLGIGLGLHWVIYSWLIQHPLGLIHAILRTVLVLALWFLFPEDRLFAIGLGIAAVYCLSIYQALSRKVVH
ncbi:hypothetical protein NBRC116493_16030 [Aurantivibrio infirmus]